MHIAGKRVFCEKPLCTTADDCKRVMEAEEASGRHLIQLGFMRRYHKGYIQIKDAIATGEYGEPLMMHCTHRNPEVGTNYNTPMAVHDTVIHEIDLCHWLVDDDYESVQVIMPKVTRYSHSELRDPQIMLMRTKSGICIDVECFVNCRFGYDINCEVVCEDGALKMGTPMAPSIRKNAAASTEITTDCFVLFKDAYDAEIQNWVDCAEKDVIEGPTTWDGYLVKSYRSDNLKYVYSAPHGFFYDKGVGDVRSMLRYAGDDLSHVLFADTYNQTKDCRYILNPPWLNSMGREDVSIHQHNPMGEGDVDFDGIFETLREMDFANRQFKVGKDAIACVSIFGYPERMEVEAPKAREIIERELLS